MITVPIEMEDCVIIITFAQYSLSLGAKAPAHRLAETLHS